MSYHYLLDDDAARRITSARGVLQLIADLCDAAGRRPTADIGLDGLSSLAMLLRDQIPDVGVMEYVYRAGDEDDGGGGE